MLFLAWRYYERTKYEHSGQALCFALAVDTMLLHIFITVIL